MSPEQATAPAALGDISREDQLRRLQIRLPIAIHIDCTGEISTRETSTREISTRETSTRFGVWPSV